MLRRFHGICSTCPLKMEIFLNVLPEAFYQKVAFVVYFGEESQVGLYVDVGECVHVVVYVCVCLWRNA